MTGSFMWFNLVLQQNFKKSSLYKTSYTEEARISELAQYQSHRCYNPQTLNQDRTVRSFWVVLTGPSPALKRESLPHIIF